MLCFAGSKYDHISQAITQAPLSLPSQRQSVGGGGSGPRMDAAAYAEVMRERQMLAGGAAGGGHGVRIER